MLFKNPYWGIITRIELLEKWLIVHSLIYYQLGTSLVSDEMFDNNSIQLLKFKENNYEELKASKWFYVFKDWEASTGFHIYSRLKKKHKKEFLNLAEFLVNKFGKKRGKLNAIR